MRLVKEPSTPQNCFCASHHELLSDRGSISQDAFAAGSSPFIFLATARAANDGFSLERMFSSDESRPTYTWRALRSIAFRMISAAFVADNGLARPFSRLASDRISIPEFPAMFVATAPGKTTVTLMLVLRSSDASPSDISLTAAFAA